jgi:Zn-finger nucleic acid-binding protein
MKNYPTCVTPLTRIQYEGFPVFKCMTCYGILVEDNKVKQIERKMALQDDDLVKEATDEAHYDNPDKIKCPRCKLTMDKRSAFDGVPGTLRSQDIPDFDIDCCMSCKLTWFDGGELARLQLSYERSIKGQETKKVYINYDDLDDAGKLEYARMMGAAQVPGTTDMVKDAVVESAIESVFNHRHSILHDDRDSFVSTMLKGLFGRR